MPETVRKAEEKKKRSKNLRVEKANLYFVDLPRSFDNNKTYATSYSNYAHNGKLIMMFFNLSNSKALLKVVHVTDAFKKRKISC